MRNILLFVLLICTCEAFATAQAPDFLIYKGEILELDVNPLEEYFEKNPDRRLKDAPVSSGLWRGYIATFEFKKNVLTLKKMITEGWDGEKSVQTSVLNKVFPDANERSLTWYSGLLVIPFGQMMSYVHLSYASEYENYLLLKVVEGKLVKTKKFTLNEYKEFKFKSFQLYKDTEHYKKTYSELAKDSEDSSYLEGFLYQMGDFYQYISVEL